MPFSAAKSCALASSIMWLKLLPLAKSRAAFKVTNKSGLDGALALIATPTEPGGALKAALLSTDISNVVGILNDRIRARKLTSLILLQGLYFLHIPWSQLPIINLDASHSSSGCMCLSISFHNSGCNFFEQNGPVPGDRNCILARPAGSDPWTCTLLGRKLDG